MFLGDLFYKLFFIFIIFQLNPGYYEGLPHF
jgi:hypothetical protein